MEARSHDQWTTRKVSPVTSSTSLMFEIALFTLSVCPSPLTCSPQHPALQDHRPVMAPVENLGPCTEILATAPPTPKLQAAGCLHHLEQEEGSQTGTSDSCARKKIHLLPELNGLSPALSNPRRRNTPTPRIQELFPSGPNAWISRAFYLLLFNH